MKPIQMLGQKTVVVDSSDSRNSIRPLLEEAGFMLDYERYSRILSVSDGLEKLVEIRGVKGIKDFRTLSYSTPLIPYFIAGSDIVGEIFLSSRRRIDQILDLQIGKCTLGFLTPPEYNAQNMNEIDVVFTKYPEFLKAKLSSVLRGNSFQGLIEYSDSPDTTLAFMLSQQQERYKNLQNEEDSIEQLEKVLGVNGRRKKIDKAIPSGLDRVKNLAAWEIIESGKSAEKLGLERETFPDFSIPVSTGLYRQRYFGEYYVEPQIQRFIEMIQAVLKREKSF